jgi:hypothetical protein
LPAALTPEFYDDSTKQKQWDAYVSKNKLYIEPITLREVTTSIREFVLPVLRPEDSLRLRWELGGPWKSA